MKFSILSDSLEKMEQTSKRLELTDILVTLLKKTPDEIISRVVYLIQGKIKPNFEGVELGIAEKNLGNKAAAKIAFKEASKDRKWKESAQYEIKMLDKES